MEVSNSSHSSPQSSPHPHYCMCVCLCVCLWAAVTSKQQSFQMTRPGDDSSATATGQVRDGGLSPSNNPPLTTTTTILHLHPRSLSQLLVVTACDRTHRFPACLFNLVFLPATCLCCAFSRSLILFIFILFCRFEVELCIQEHILN